MDIKNGAPLINGQTYNWGDIVVLIGGVPQLSITAIEYSDKQEKKNLYGAGRVPVARGKGRIEATAKITLEMNEVLNLKAQASNGRLQDIAPFDIQVSYLPENGLIVHDTIRNCEFKEDKRTWKEGDMNQPVELELIVSHIEWSK